MRKAAIILFLAGPTLLSCAAPEFQLRPRFRLGELRDYRLVADATVRIAGASSTTTQRTRLVAATRLEVLNISTNGATTLALTLTPRSITRDGKPGEPPAPQKILIVVSGGGLVTDVTTSGDQAAALEAADIEDLVPLIGPPLPPHRVHLADRWVASPAPGPSSSASPGTTPAPEGTPVSQEARLASLRVVDGFNCAIVALSTRRPVVRDRMIGGSPLRLQGVEFAAGEIAFAFREGFPVTVRSNSQARLGISSVAGESGSVVIDTTTTLTLVHRSVPGAR